MAYTKQEWIAKQTVITADRMNHIEDGIAALSEATGTQWFFTAVDVQSSGTVALTDIVVPDGWVVAPNSLLVDGHGDIYVITAVAGDNATVGNALPVNLKGPKGDRGDAGVAGPAGPKGDKGDSGMTPQPAITDVAAGADAAALVTAHNALLAALRKAGVIANK